MIRAHAMHNVEVVDIFAAFLVSFGRDNYIELFTFQLKNHSVNELEYFRLIQDLTPTLASTTKGKYAFIESGALSMIMDMCIQVCEFATGNLNNDFRQTAVVLMVQIWRTKPEIVQSHMNDG
jgi:hypothetical protein